VLEPPRLDLWRAPTDNDAGFGSHGLVDTWRGIGLDRLRHRLVGLDLSSDVGGDVLTVRERVAPAATDLGFAVTYRWTGVPDGVRLDVTVEPEGELPCPLPRLGLRMRLPRHLDHVMWFGRGPGEAYADTGYSTRVGRFAADVDALQTPYVHPQENGTRAAVRWAKLTDPAGAGVRVEGVPTLALTVRRWSTEQLDAARHTSELTDEGSLFVNLDVAQHGIGTGSCGPGVLPQYVLTAAPTSFAVVLRAIS
jgi:beta-galactosidase